MCLSPLDGIMHGVDPLERNASWQEEENFYVGRAEHGIGPPFH
jgi:hypothetical protein